MDREFIQRLVNFLALQESRILMLETLVLGDLEPEEVESRVQAVVGMRQEAWNLTGARNFVDIAHLLGLNVDHQTLLQAGPGPEFDEYLRRHEPGEAS